MAMTWVQSLDRELTSLKLRGAVKEKKEIKLKKIKLSDFLE